ncbi:MAG: SBBP repeat-containing protein, partial [Pseudomonadota bacterium]
GIVVVEAAAARIVHVETSGARRVLAEIPGGSPGAPGLPPSQIFNGIAIDADGNLFVTGESSRVLYRIKAPW